MTTKDLMQITMMTSLLVVLGFIPGIPLGFIPVPIILQNLGVMLAGVLLGGKKGTLAVLMLLLVGLVIPVFSGTSGTPAVLSGPTAGYVVSWIFVPFLTEAGLRLLSRPNPWKIYICIWLSGVLFVDVVGSIYLAYYSKMPLIAALTSNLVFIPGDSLKALVATLIALRFPHLSGIGRKGSRG